MKFAVSNNVFDILENICFGVVVAKGVHNSKQHQEIDQLLEQNIRSVMAHFRTIDLKVADEIKPYRIAFRKLGINPNKYRSSIEAMVSRIVKKKNFPSINPIVDLGNAISLKYLVPLGAHNLDSATGDIKVRFSETGDRFLPIGGQKEEYLSPGELIYSVGNIVATRRWIWRQSEQGKVTDLSGTIFFPIDGFTDYNYRQVIAAKNELADLLERIFNCEVSQGLLDSRNRQMEF